MKLKELLELGEKYSRFADIEINGVTSNSRIVRDGYAFVCIDGVNVDGHKYAKDAIESGAAIIIAEKDTGLDNQIIVENTRATYALMCAAFFGNPAEKLKVVGVTGTNGKTTTTTLLKHILEEQGHKVGLIGTIQNMVGTQVLPAKSTTPDAFELHSLIAVMLQAGCDYVVMEVSSHSIAQYRVHGIHFATCVFTNLTQDHLDYHKTMENYLAAKLQIFSRCDNAIINLDDPYSQDFINASKCNVFTYSTKSDEATFTAKNITYKSNGTDFELVGDANISRVHINTPGTFSVYNAMAAGVAAISLGLDFQTSVDSLRSAQCVKGRAEVVPNDLGFTIIIDYAHTPDGLQNIIDAINTNKTNRLITVFGCGGDRDKTKRPQMGAIAAKCSDYVVVTSDNPRTEHPGNIINDILEGMKDTKTPYTVIENRERAVEFAMREAKENDILLLAGKGHETYQILGTSTVHMDEREIVASVEKIIKSER